MERKKNNGFWQRWRRKYRLVILSADNFEERLSFMLSRLNIFVFSSFVLLFLIGGTCLLIALTPIREYIPGYTSSNMRRDVVELNRLSDSLLVVIESKDRYLENIRHIIQGSHPTEKTDSLFGKKDLSAGVVFETVAEDSILRQQVEDEERFSLFAPSKKQSNGVESLLFFAPLKGVITQEFMPENKHWGVDVVAKENEAVKATLNGVVVFSSWTSETGYVIGLLHENNLFSIYEHNSVLLKKEGDKVEVGEPIAIIGNTGELSTGPHLHFELWHNGKPINPELYMVF